nr:hypothetical protein [Tanacetum cinerariifolium]
MISASTNLVTSSWIALFLSGACPLLFFLMGWHPSRMFKRCFDMDLGTPVIYAVFQENISKLSLSRLQSFILPFSDKLSPIMTVCSGYYGWIATLIPSVAAGSLGGRTFFVLPPFRTPLVLWYCCVLSLFFLLLGILAFRER